MVETQKWHNWDWGWVVLIVAWDNIVAKGLGNGCSPSTKFGTKGLGLGWFGCGLGQHRCQGAWYWL